MSRQKRSLLSLLWVFPAIWGMSASAVVFFSPGLSNMKWWGFRLFLMKSIGCCLFLHLGISLWLLVRRAWLRCLGASLLLLFVFLSAFMAVFVSGPDIETVRLKAAEATGIRASHLVCIGGRLSRESRVVFEVKENDSSNGIGEEVNSQDDTTCQILIQALSFVHVEVSVAEKLVIRKFPMKFDTVFMVRTAERSYIIFFGQSVM